MFQAINQATSLFHWRRNQPGLPPESPPELGRRGGGVGLPPDVRGCAVSAGSTTLLLPGALLGVLPGALLGVLSRTTLSRSPMASPIVANGRVSRFMRGMWCGLILLCSSHEECNESVKLLYHFYTKKRGRGEGRVEQVKGIEPSHKPWQGFRLPLHHTCVIINRLHVFQVPSRDHQYIHIHEYF